jgi:hypothetical protein
MGLAGIARVAAGWDLDAGADRVHQLLHATLPTTAGAAADAMLASSVPS